MSPGAAPRRNELASGNPTPDLQNKSPHTSISTLTPKSFVITNYDQDGLSKSLLATMTDVNLVLQWLLQNFYCGRLDYYDRYGAVLVLRSSECSCDL